MKRLLLAVAFLPLVSFGAFDYDGMTVERMRFITWTGASITINPTRAPTVFPSSFEELQAALCSSTFGFLVNLSSAQSQKLIVPVSKSSPSSFVEGTSTKTTITNSLYVVSNNVGYVVSPMVFPALASVYQSVAMLYCEGYRGVGIVDDFSVNSNVHCINVNYPSLVADVLSSTNSLYRQILFSYLAQINNSLTSIQTSVNNVNVDLGQFQSDYSFVNSSHFDVSNVIDVAVSDSVIPSRVATSLKSLARDPSNYDYIHSVLDSYRRAQWLPLAFSDSDLASPLHNDNRVKQGLKNLGDSFGAGASYHYTTPLTNELQKLNTNWVSEAKAALSNNTQQITNQLAHMFDDTPNGIGRVMRDAANNTLSAANAAGSIDERLQRGITVAVVNEGNTSVGVHLDGPVNIDTTQWQTLSTPLGGLRDTVSAMWDGFYQFYNMGSSNYDWSHFFDMVQTFKEQNHIDLAAISSQSVTGDVGRIYDYLSGYQSNILYQIATSTNSLDWSPWFDKWTPFADIVTNYYVEYNSSVPSSDIALDFLESGFDSDRYSSLPWFQRVEVLLAMIADVRSNSVEVADIQEDMEQQAEDFRALSTNVVGISENVFGLFQYVQRFSNSLQSVFGDRAAPLTGDYVLLPAGSWIFDHPLTLRINPTIQNFCRLIMQCIWYLGFLVLLWVVVNWTWQKVVAVLRWLWSMFDV